MRCRLRVVLAILLWAAGQQTAPALERVALGIDRLEAEGWRLEGIELALSGLAEPSQQLTLHVDKLVLPKPFERVELADFRCTDFSWGNGEMSCRQGTAFIKSGLAQPLRLSCTFHIAARRSEFHLDGQLGGGEVSLDAEASGRHWRFQGRAAGIAGRFFKRYLTADYQLEQGKLDLDIRADGDDLEMNGISVDALFDQFSGQTSDGRIAAEKAVLAASFKAYRERGRWRWRGRLEFRDGAAYVAPVYLEAKPKALSFDVAGGWDGRSRKVEVDYFGFRHPGVGYLSGYGTLDFGSKTVLEQGRISLTAADLKTLSAVYLEPFLLGTAMEGLAPDGRLGADVSVDHQTVTACSLDFDHLDVEDGRGRFSLRDGVGVVRWAAAEDFSRPSIIAWRQLKLYRLPVGPAQLTFLAKAKAVRLLEKARIPFLEGDLKIDRFDWRSHAGADPDVHFVGAVEQVSLKRLTEALQWTPLSGRLNGRIPGVNFDHGQLALQGELAIDVFGGKISIKNLSSEGLFSTYPRLSGDVDIENLDLKQLTHTFKIGGIEGRLSGYFSDFYLENWRPVAFYGWLGTPDDDSSRHRITQKAVENIGSIGGGSVTQLFSSTFLRYFNTFDYDRIGMGCYLHQGVCQLLGVAPAKQGYYIVKGKGLPRINVVGYNPRIDWPVLLRRIRAVVATQ